MTRIQLRRDTSVNWSTNNPVPSAGEPCFEIDTGKLKIGDGSNTYTNLPYIEGGGSSGGGDVTQAGDNTFTGTNTFDGNVYTKNFWVSPTGKQWDALRIIKNDGGATFSLGTSGDISFEMTDADAGLVVGDNMRDIHNTNTAKYYLKQDSITAGDNVSIEETTKGLKISATGGSTPDNMVTTDTAQTITGLKTFTPADAASYGVKTGLAVGLMRLGTDTSISPNPVISGENIKIVNSAGTQIAAFESSENITFGNGMSAMSLNCLANTTNIKAGASTNYMGNLAVGVRTLTYTSATGETTDLLAGGTSDSLVKSVDSNFSVDDSGQLSLANTLSIGSSVTTGTLTASLQVGTPAIRFGTYGGAYVRPEITYNSTDGMKINAEAIESTGNVMKPVTVIASEFKAGDGSNQYDVVTKSADNNTYMAHMAMPSDTYVDLTLGASGTTYTAPADGYIYLRRYAASNNTVSTAYIQVYTDEGRFDSRAMQVDWTKTSGSGELYLFIPIRKDKSFIINYRDFSSLTDSSTFTRFFYAVGSEPSS